MFTSIAQQITSLCLRALSGAALCFLAVFAWSSPSDERIASDFALRSSAGVNVRLSEHLGDVVLLNFWGSWCGACREQLPVLSALQARYQRAGLALLSVNLDDAPDAGVQAAQRAGIPHPILFDKDQIVARAFDVDTLPLTLVIDRAGVVRQVFEGYRPRDEQQYIETLRELLNE